jgi:hypothetical protein
VLCLVTWCVSRTSLDTSFYKSFGFKGLSLVHYNITLELFTLIKPKHYLRSRAFKHDLQRVTFANNLCYEINFNIFSPIVVEREIFFNALFPRMRTFEFIQKMLSFRKFDRIRRTFSRNIPLQADVIGRAA